MGCKHSVELSPRSPSPEEEAKAAATTKLLVHHAARRPPLPWEEELCTEMMALLSKSSVVKLNARDVRRFALQFCYGNLHDTSEEMVSRCVRRALQINRVMQAQGYKFFRVVLAENVAGSMTGSVLKGLVLRTAEDVGHERVKATGMTQAFSGRSVAIEDDADDDLDSDEVLDVTDDLDAIL